MSGYRYPRDSEKRFRSYANREDIRNYDIYKLSANSESPLLLPGLTPVPTPTQSPPSTPTSPRKASQLCASQFLQPGILGTISVSRIARAMGSNARSGKPEDLIPENRNTEAQTPYLNLNPESYTNLELPAQNYYSDLGLYPDRTQGKLKRKIAPTNLLSSRNENEPKLRRRSRKRLRKDHFHTTASDSQLIPRDGNEASDEKDDTTASSSEDEGRISECDTVVPDDFSVLDSDSSDIEILTQSGEHVLLF